MYYKGLQEVYPYINIVLRIFLYIPVTNCSAERSFSVLRRVKNYLRSTMCDERLNCSAVLTIESEIAKRINYDDIIDSFPDAQSRRKVIK
ncbi:Zinc finger MYM-type protein 1 [Trachymyrmex cornetzi]|uniref:Zinc finger MYM-type protein 1 n=1 Tax=Trachymyrmex cornetzi TaxID=471704 RepID=A0A151J4Q4_9HYME|nr:Zinc finger MYM-type protein 1 [Trachymyrmex cornetzi]